MKFTTSLVRVSPSCRLPCSWKCCAGSVLYMVDLVDEYAVPQFNEFDVTEADVHDKKNVVSVAKIRRRWTR